MKKFFCALTLSVLVCSLLSFKCSAAGDIGGGTMGNPRFRIGDLIEVDPNMNSASYDGQTLWKAGTVKRISDGAYWVELDEYPGRAPVTVGIQPNQWARPLRAAAQQPLANQRSQQAQQARDVGGAGGVGGGTMSNPRFKIGDRIEVDPNMNSASYDGKTNWKIGTVKRISDGAYWVDVEENPGRAPVAIGIQPNQWARPLSGGAQANAGQAAQIPQQAPGNHQPQHGQQAPANQLQPHGQQGPANQQQPHGQQVPGISTSIEPHHGPHVPTIEHIKQMIISEDGYSYQMEFPIVKIAFQDVQISPATIPDLKNITTGRLRMDGIPVHPVRAKYTIFVSTSSGDIKHFFELDRSYYWLIDNRGECTLGKTNTVRKQIY